MFNFLIYLDGRLEEVMMDKITMRIEQLCDGLNMDFIDPVIWYFILLFYNIDLGIIYYLNKYFQGYFKLKSESI